MVPIIKHDDWEAQLKVEAAGGSAASSRLPQRGVIPAGAPQALAEAAQLVAAARAEADLWKAQAKDLLAQAQAHVEAERKRGFEQGLQQGLAEASEKIAQASAYREKVFNEAEGEIVQMVMQIAEKIVGDTIQLGGVAAVVKQALKEAIGEKVTVRVNPKDLKALRDQEESLTRELQHIKSVALVGDEEVAVGGCCVDTEVGTIDAQLSTQLAAIKKSLGLET